MKNDHDITRNEVIYHLYETGEYTYDQIAKLYDVTRERIRQVYLKEKEKRKKERILKVIREDH